MCPSVRPPHPFPKHSPPPKKTQNPSLRAKNPDLYTLAEKATLRHLVEVMLGCGVAYVQTAQQQGQQGAFGACVWGVGLWWGCDVGAACLL